MRYGDKYMYIPVPTNKPRLVLYMNPEILEALKEWAANERRTPSNLAIYLIEKALEQKQGEFKRSPLKNDRTQSPTASRTKTKAEASENGKGRGKRLQSQPTSTDSST